MLFFLFCLKYIFASNLENLSDWRGFLLCATDFEIFGQLPETNQGQLISALFMAGIHFKLEKLRINSNDPLLKAQNKSYNAFIDSIVKEITALLKFINKKNVAQEMPKANQNIKNLLSKLPPNDSAVSNLNKTFNSLTKTMFAKGDLANAYNDCMTSIESSSLDNKMKKEVKEKLQRFACLITPNTNLPNQKIEDIYISANTF